MSASTSAASRNKDAMTFPQRHLLSRRHFCLCCIAGATIRRHQRVADAARSLRGGPRPRQPDQGQRRRCADRHAQAAQQCQRARRLRRQHRRSDRPRRQGAHRRRHRRIAPQITKALADSAPIRSPTSINTHWHFDHADGNEWLHSVGAKIIAQENTRKHLSGVQRVEDWDYNFLPPPPGGFPARCLRPSAA